MPKLKDRTPKSGGRSAAFQLRIHPQLHDQLRQLTDNENVTLACWLKDLARRELRRRGIEPLG
ncbi:toxin-antitoxin system HicB family antitoxin [Erwinia sorbitola]|uniref:Toxin-antitoxin system HicB family antitoxin n=1 Tax=Erwinia sorbitola TaxID=2681984 RepID=A0A6I6E9L0_9GAMM|nr:toxin-antitoxin system HicB family antitoxin [Erwinia sorbitola]MTD28305.1 toxin-antitoxin system HicB family antitoxin [Erwinia sorbitola]QGU86427.1 toxin-antitoxin system HicB family antitoxin [Erwinia sorbitola]